MTRKVICLMKSFVWWSNKMGKKSIYVLNACNKSKIFNNINKYTIFQMKTIAFIIIITLQVINCLNLNYR